MKIKSGYMLREIAGHHVVLPLGVRVVEFNGVITLNTTGAFLWNNMVSDITEDELIKRLTSEYNIDETTARNDLQEFIAVLRDNSLLDTTQ